MIRTFGIFAILMVLVMLFVGSAYANPVKVPPADEDCWALKFDTPQDGDYDAPEVEMTVSNDITTVTWKSNVPVSKIYVFGGNDGYWVDYDFPAFSGTFESELTGPQGQIQQISNVTFYFCPTEDEEPIGDAEEKDPIDEDSKDDDPEGKDPVDDPSDEEEPPVNGEDEPVDEEPIGGGDEYPPELPRTDGRAILSWGLGILIFGWMLRRISVKV